MHVHVLQFFLSFYQLEIIESLTMRIVELEKKYDAMEQQLAVLVKLLPL